jgi:hypothetical protein
MRAAMGVASLVLLVSGLAVEQRLLAGAPVLLLVAWLFHALTIEVSTDTLTWKFGPGLVRKSVPLADLATARAVRTTWLDGWGIHWGRHGWLYNVSGNDAIAVTTHQGKRFALGTDEPQALLKALRERRIKVLP